MELGNQIKAHRAALSLSQEELAEKVYVTRQTVSNWETSKSYPDIHSLLLLSALFDVSLDQLIKGDLETMKQEVNAADVKAMNRDAIIYTVLLAATIILPVPLIKWFGLYGLIPELLLWGSAMYFALRLERIKKANNVQSYKEILAFSEGRKLDEIEQKVEAGKRPYQKLLLVLLTAGITLLVGMVLSWLLLKANITKPAPTQKRQGGFSIFRSRFHILKRLRASSRSDGTRRTMRSGMMSPMQMTSTTSDQLGCHTSRKYRSRQYSTPIAIRPTAPMHMAMEERRERLPSRSRKLSRNTTTHAQPSIGSTSPRNQRPPCSATEMIHT